MTFWPSSASWSEFGQTLARSRLENQQTSDQRLDSERALTGAAACM